MMVNEVVNSEWNGIISMRGAALRPISSTLMRLVNTVHFAGACHMYAPRKHLLHILTAELDQPSDSPYLNYLWGKLSLSRSFCHWTSAQAQRLQYDCFSTSIIRILLDMKNLY